MNAAAQKWADSLALIDDSLTRRTRARYGENLWMVEGAQMEDLMNNDLNPVKDWYSEVVNYPGYFDNVTFPRYGMQAKKFKFSTKHLDILYQKRVGRTSKIFKIVEQPTRTCNPANINVAYVVLFAVQRVVYEGCFKSKVTVSKNQWRKQVRKFEQKILFVKKLSFFDVIAESI